MNVQADWRLHGAFDVDVVSDNEVQIRSGGRSTIELVDPVLLPDGRTLALPIPNATAMMLHVSRRAYGDVQKLLAADLHRDDPRDIYSMDSSSDAVDVVESLILSVFAAYTSIECFANEWIPPWVTYRKEDRKGGHKILGKEDMERHLPLGRKLDYVLPRVFKVASPKGNSKGNQLWESFVKLEAARNRVVHMKQADRETADAGVGTVWKMLFQLPAPHLTAKGLVDWYMAGAPHIPGLAYDNQLPVKPRWCVNFPP
jgi:hypothetical protein